MPIERTLHANHVETTMSGSVDYGQICEHLLFLYEIRQSTGIFIEFLDLRQVTSIDLDARQARSLGERVSNLHNKYDHSHIIAVAPTDSCFGVARMIEAFVSLNNPTVSWHILRDIQSAQLTLAALSEAQA